MAQSNQILPLVLGAIGATPSVELQRPTRGTGGRIVAQLEHLHPGFSTKDRIAREMIKAAEAQGHLTPGQTAGEMASGNTGPGLAIVCGSKHLRTYLHP